MDRIISDFHYRRSGAYVVDSRREHPGDPWPEVAALRSPSCLNCIKQVFVSLHEGYMSFVQERI